METTTQKKKQAVGQASKLNTLLATYQVHYQHLRAAHWNVKGPHFFELHLKFQELYDTAALTVDAIAERILMTGGQPLSTFQAYLDHSMLDEAGDKTEAFDLVALAAKDFEVLIRLGHECRDQAEKDNDTGTADMLTQHIALNEKQLWMLRAWLDHH